MPFADESFYMVVFDPPHLVRAGENQWLAKKYEMERGPDFITRSWVALATNHYFGISKVRYEGVEDLYAERLQAYYYFTRRS